MIAQQRDKSDPLKRLTASVAMCTYNGEHYLAEQLSSILHQTVAPDELVICDDGSSDGTVEILQAFAAAAPFRVRIFVNTTNLRPALNFAQCIALCSGDVIVLSDQDDIWNAERIEQTRQIFSERSEIAFSFSDAGLIDGSGRQTGRTIYSSLPIHGRDRRRVKRGDDLLRVLMRWGVLYGATMAFRASQRSLILPIPAGWSHDEWIGLVLSSVAPSYRMDQPVMSYRQHDAQEVGTGEWTAATHLQWAQSRGTDLYRREIRKYEAAIEAVQQRDELSKKLLSHLVRKLKYLQRRVRVQRGRLRDLPLFIFMLLRGEYARYGSGVRSSLKDLSMLLLGERLQARYARRQS